MSSNEPKIPWLEQTIAENPGHTAIDVCIWLVNALCDPSVRVEHEPELYDVEVPKGYEIIVDAEGDIVCLVPTKRAGEMARLLNEASG